MKKVLESVLGELVICCLEYATCVAIHGLARTEHNLSRRILGVESDEPNGSSVKEAAGKMDLLVSIIEKSVLETREIEEVKRMANHIAFNNKQNHERVNKIVERLKTKVVKADLT